MNSSTPLPPRQKPQRRKASDKKRGIPKWLKVTLISVLVVSIGILSYAGYLLFYANSKLEDISTVSKEGEGSGTVQETLSPTKEPFSFILLGIDYRPELPGRRTDVVMVGAMHPETQEAVLVSLPRDTYFELTGYTPDKLNHYYPKFFTLKEQGKLDSASPEDEMKAMLGQYLDINIDYAAVIDFKGFVDVVDAVGGVDVNVDQNMCYRDRADGTNINLSAGLQTLDGKNTLDFVRYRKSNCRPMTKGTTDGDRNVRQNAVLQELVGKMQTLGGIAKITDIIDAMANNFKIDMTPSQIRNSLTTYIGINRNDIHYMPVDGDWKSPYIYVNQEQLEQGKQALKDVLAGRSLKAPQPADSESGTSGTDSDKTTAPAA
ncbi:LCP family protein [Paenibacillus apiarius]|uniref:LCP family protein n=1 Tax=Paenibacillus apiarius TaxID=46240 RepID=A0ABT4DMZ8_9BACL|nr:LCP family protein [Paenibacillus apiarius]MBN3525939.1 LCP family protein [Paenibacillus apiarius]MCY9513564.1 LCP family protein [Paenibacillus apiarius]MCY9518115.1 LCP family protein [Paenibacillus apiarius]MCY9551484.1 LCP family protein [Paenibacillus apiarius]MCY9558638.1 LCP family protein [Paenibacillus apiarius]